MIVTRNYHNSCIGISTLCIEGQCHKNWKKKNSIFTQKFKQNYGDDSDKEYIFEVDVSYSKRLQKMHSNLLFLSERMKIDKPQKLVCNIYDNKNYIIHIKALKLVLDYRLILEKVHRVIELSQEA